MPGLDTNIARQLGLDYAAGINAPVPGQEGFVTVVDETGKNLLYVPADTIGSPGPTVAKRITAPDASTVIRWKLDEPSGNWLNTGSGAACPLVESGSTHTLVRARRGILGPCLEQISNTGTPALETANTSVGESNSLTLSLWFQPASDGSPGYSTEQLLVGKNASAGNTWGDPFATGLVTIHGQLWFYYVVGSGGHQLSAFSPRNNGGSQDTLASLPAGVWHHIAATFDAATGTASLYRNGLLVGQEIVGASNLGWGAHGPWAVGHRFSLASAGAKVFGAFADIRVENVVRSQAYLSDLYHQGTGLFL